MRGSPGRPNVLPTVQPTVAIEPLIENIRSSQLKGFNISDDLTRVLVKAYADDTTVYIGPEDDPHHLQSCLDLFCKALTAKFNDRKTEIIPLGLAETRLDTIRTRQYNGWKVDDGIRIAQEGEATRILGSWQGHGINIQAKWNEMLEKQQKSMKLWNLSYPSVTGRVLIAKALIVSLAYYLMTVNGIT